MRRTPLRRPALWRVLLLGSSLMLGTACADDASGGEEADAGGAVDASGDAAGEVDTAALWSEYQPPEPPVPRLTEKQLENALHDVFGDDIVVPPIAQTELLVGGFLTVGAGVDTISPRAAEDLERASRDIGRQVVAEGRDGRPELCEGASVDDIACHESVLRTYGDRLWRRPMTDTEAARVATVSANAAGVLDSFHDGLTYGIAALVQSPNFLFRRELGALDDTTGRRVFQDYELASRLSFLLWNTTPDDELLAAAANGELTTDEGLAAQAQRLLGDDRAREGVLEFFTEWYELDELLHLTKDPAVFLAMDADLGPSARTETLMSLEHLIFELDGDFRELLTTNRTFLNRQLAALYGVPSPTREGFAEAYLPPDAGRRGLLGQASLLMLHSHPVSSSATLRGLFVREYLLCMPVDPPPSDVDTSIPEPSGTTLTLRDRVAEHLEAETCRGCHLQMDPIGLGLENFDGIGQWRTTDNGAPIDPSGDLDGEDFTDAWELGALVAAHPRYGYCASQQWMRFGTGQVEQLEQLPGVRALAAEFEASDYRVLDMIEAFVLSPAFRTAGAIDTTPASEGGQ